LRSPATTLTERRHTRNSRPLGFGCFGLCPEVDHVGDLADQLDLEAVLCRMQHDSLDEAAQDLQRLSLRLRVAESHLQAGDLAPIDLGEVGVKPRRWGRGGGKLGLERRLAALQLVELGLEPRRAQV